MMCPLGSPKVAMLLISLGIGYLVCVKAEAQKGFLRQLGYWIGSIIIVLSILIALCSSYCHMKKGLCGPRMPHKICDMPMKQK